MSFLEFMGSNPILTIILALIIFSSVVELVQVIRKKR